MTDMNHRRKNRKPVNQRYAPEEYGNGIAYPDNKDAAAGRVGKTDYLDKSMKGWRGTAVLGDKKVYATIPNDFANGHRGMARAVKGAKKNVRTRIRFHENSATRRLATGPEEDR